MVAIPWKFESSYPHQLWGCSSVDRALRSHRRGRGFESHQLHQVFVKSLRGYGGMVDAEDLKSFGHCDRVGSSPTIPTTNKKNRRLAVVFIVCFLVRLLNLAVVLAVLLPGVYVALEKYHYKILPTESGQRSDKAQTKYSGFLSWGDPLL